jgi:hypothetical protein
MLSAVKQKKAKYGNILFGNKWLAFYFSNGVIQKSSVKGDRDFNQIQNY